MTDSDGRARAIAAELLAQAQMPDGQVAERARFAADPQYWSGLAPEMSVGNAPRAASRSVPVATLDAVRRHFATDGYFQTPPLLDQSDLARLNGAIDAVTGAGWPPVFAWVYDAFWVLARLPDVSDLLASQLGAGFSQIPHVWTHVVPATVGATGWPPHFDGPSRGRASIWIALTDATLANGCMHLVPRRRLSDAFTTEPLDTGRVPLVDALRALHGVRALPAPPGAVLGWTFDVLHWGGACLSAEGTRRAISLEFIAAGVIGAFRGIGCGQEDHDRYEPARVLAVARIRRRRRVHVRPEEPAGLVDEILRRFAEIERHTKMLCKTGAPCLEPIADETIDSRRHFHRQRLARVRPDGGLTGADVDRRGFVRSVEHEFEKATAFGRRQTPRVNV